MEPSALISIIVIGYNISKYVKRCLDSVFQQTANNYETIFVDDGSKDDTILIAEGYKDAHPNFLVVKKENGGIISARKAGVRASKGDFILFVDGDDALCPDTVAQFNSQLQEAPKNVDLIVSDFLTQTSKGDFLARKSTLTYGCYEGDAYFKGIMSDRLEHYMFAKLYRRQFILDSGYLDFPNISMAEDLYTNAVFGMHSPVFCYFSGKTYQYFYNMTSMSRGENPKVLEQVKTQEMLCAAGEKNGWYAKYRSYFDYYWISYCLAYAHINSWSFKFRQKIVNQCKPHLKSYRNNPIYKDRRAPKLSFIRKLYFWSFIHFPFAARLMDAILRKRLERKNTNVN